MPVRSGISGGGSGGSSEDTPAECRLPARSPRGGVGESSPVDEQSDDAGLRTLARNCGRPDLGATAIANTDNRVVKNEQVRFNFGDRAQVLEHSLYPTPEPEPELGVVQVYDSGLTSLDYVHRIERLEVGDQVGFLFVLSSQNPIDLPRRASVRLLRGA